MKEYRSASRANPVTPANSFLPQINFYPTSYANSAAALADIANLHVVLFLHGAGEYGTNLDNLYGADLPKGLKYTGDNINKEGYFVIAPQLKNSYDQFSDEFTNKGRSRIYDMLITEFSGAKSYNITGLSRGGQGCYNFVASYPSFFRTMGCLAGNDWQSDNEVGFNPISPIANTAITDIRHWHGEDDSSSNTYLGGQQTVSRLITQEYPNEITFITMPSPAAHDIWPDVYVNDDLYWAWLESKEFSGYPSSDPHSAGALEAGDETIVESALVTITDYTTNLKSNDDATAIQWFNGRVYYVYCDENRRPKLVKVDDDGSNKTETFLDTASPTYAALDNTHNVFSIGIDTDGYIHVVGDMHGWRADSPNAPAKVARYDGSEIMYWVSDSPEDITSFSFYGYDTDANRPLGYTWSYTKFYTDNNGVLYLSARNACHENNHGVGGAPTGSWNGTAIVGLYRYDVVSQTWTTLGGLAPTVHGNTAIYKGVFWADSGEYWQDEPADPDHSRYQGFYAGLRFDLDNNMHFCWTINDTPNNRQSDHVIYWKSTDGGYTFEKADGTSLTAPVRPSGSNIGDIVKTGRVMDMGWVDVDWGGNPVISYTKYVDDSQDEFASVQSPPRTRIYRSSSWESAIDMPVENNSARSNLAQGSDYILTYFRRRIGSPSNAYIHRTRRYGESGYTYSVGGQMSGWDFMRFTKENELYMVVYTGTSQVVKKITFGAAVVPGGQGVKALLF